MLKIYTQMLARSIPTKMLTYLLFGARLVVNSNLDSKISASSLGLSDASRFFFPFFF